MTYKVTIELFEKDLMQVIQTLDVVRDWEREFGTVLANAKVEQVS